MKKIDLNEYKKSRILYHTYNILSIIKHKSDLQKLNQTKKVKLSS